MPASWHDNAITLAWLGHATVLINFYGVRILTEPTLFRRIGVDVGIGPIGPLRLDTPSLAAVRGKPVAIMATGTADLPPQRHYSSVRELRWNESIKVSTLHGELAARGIEVKMADAAGARLFVWPRPQGERAVGGLATLPDARGGKIRAARAVARSRIPS